MFFLRRIIARLLFVTVLGWIVKKLRTSNDPRAQKVGDTANRLLGGVFGVEQTRGMRPKRRIGRSAGSAAVGGIMSYFFDPQHGHDRRARVKTFASQKLSRNGQTPALPAAKFTAGPTGSTYSPSSIT